MDRTCTEKRQHQYYLNSSVSSGNQDKGAGHGEHEQEQKTKDLDRSGKSWNDRKKLAQDREGWKVFVCVA